MIYLGHHLGLYRALQDAGAVTSDELAQRTGLHERWVREWLHGQAAAGLLDYAGDSASRSPIAALVLANEQSPAFAAAHCGVAATDERVGTTAPIVRHRRRPA
jgi:hypothetical protein